MRYLFIVTFSILLVSCGQDEQPKTSEHDHDHEMMQPDSAGMHAEQLIYYTCPMEEHKQVHSAEPGTCPECGMELVAGVVTTEDQMEFYGCPMLTHSYVRSDTAGTCPDCGMQLKPMRLVAP